MRPSAGTVLFQCKEPSPWAHTAQPEEPVSAKEVQSWPPQNCLASLLLVQFSPKLLHSYPNAPSTHTYGHDSLHTPVCLSTPTLITVSSSSEAQLSAQHLPGWPEILKTARATGTYLHHKHSETAQIHHLLWGWGLPLERPSQTNAKKEYARTCQQQWPKGQHVNGVHSKFSPVPH